MSEKSLRAAARDIRSEDQFVRLLRGEIAELESLTSLTPFLAKELQLLTELLHLKMQTRG